MEGVEKTYDSFEELPDLDCGLVAAVDDLRNAAAPESQHLVARSSEISGWMICL